MFADPRVHPGFSVASIEASSPASCSPRNATSPMHAALAVLLRLNGLRVSEACATDIEDLGFERGHRISRIVGKGNKPA